MEILGYFITVVICVAALIVFLSRTISKREKRKKTVDKVMPKLKMTDAKLTLVNKKYYIEIQWDGEWMRYDSIGGLEHFFDETAVAYPFRNKKMA